MNKKNKETAFEQSLHLSKEHKLLISNELQKEMTNKWLSNIFRVFRSKDLDSDL